MEDKYKESRDGVMGQATIFDNLREWIGGVAFAVYLWSVRMTKEEFWDEQEKQAKRSINIGTPATDTHNHNWIASTLENVIAVCSVCGYKLVKFQ